MRNWETQQQCSPAFGAVVTAACPKHVPVCVNSSSALTEAVTSFRMVPGCCCCLVKSVPRQNPGRWHSGAGSVMGLLNGLSAATSPCLSSLLGNEILFGFFFKVLSQSCPSEKMVCFAREGALPVRTLQETLGYVRNRPKVALGQQSMGVQAQPWLLSGITDSAHCVSLLQETCPHLQPQTAGIRAGSHQKERDSNFSPVRSAVRYFTNTCKDRVCGLGSSKVGIGGR